MTKLPVEKTTSWWNDMLTKWQVNKWPIKNDQLNKWWANKMTRYQTNQIMKWPFVEMTRWPNDVAPFFVSSSLTSVARWFDNAGNPHWTERISTVDLLVLTCSDQLLSILKTHIFLFYQIGCLNEEVNCSEPSRSVRIPRIMWSDNES
jgi:hypothetical protein